MAAEYLGGLLMVIFLAIIFRLTLTPRLVKLAKEQAEKGRQGRMEGHAAMDMSVSGGSFWQKLFSGKGVTAVSHSFVMDWASVWVDIVLGLLIAGAASAWVPESFWRTFFLSNNPTLARIEGPVVGEMSHHQMHHGEVEPQYPTPYEHHESKRAEHHQSPHDVVGTEPCKSQQ
jgi:uncharacterized protein